MKTSDLQTSSPWKAQEEKKVLSLSLSLLTIVAAGRVTKGGSSCVNPGRLGGRAFIVEWVAISIND